MLYASAYGWEILFGNASQQQSGVAQLVPNRKGATTTTVGMSMATSIWIINFAAVYALKPSLAAKMPAWWTPIPDDVVQALEASPTGRVPYGRFASSFPGSTPPDRGRVPRRHRACSGGVSAASRKTSVGVL
jgi:hypothetical protein